MERDGCGGREDKSNREVEARGWKSGHKIGCLHHYYDHKKIDKNKKQKMTAGVNVKRKKQWAKEYKSKISSNFQ